MDDGISLRGITKKYGSFEALKGVTLPIKQGTVFGLLGPNGAGKTTILRICSTLLKPTSGEVFFEGKESVAHQSAIRRSLAVMPQGSALDPFLNVEDNLRFYCKLRDVRREQIDPDIEKVVEIFGLDSFRKKGVLALSGGQFRRAQLARTFLGKPKYILLDEPTLGIDIQGKLTIWQAVKDYASENNCTILLASNDITEVEKTCNQVGFINGGQLLYVGNTDNLSGKIHIKLNAKLAKRYEPVSGFSGNDIRVTHESDNVITLEFKEYTGKVFNFLDTLASDFGIVSMTERKTSLTDLFDKYGRASK